jgi:hypothetical protein
MGIGPFEKGRKDERKRQEELERANEMDGNKLSIKRGLGKKSGTSVKYLIYVIILAIVLAVVAWLLLNVTVTNVLPEMLCRSRQTTVFRSLKAGRLPSATPTSMYLATKMSSYLISMVIGKTGCRRRQDYCRNAGQLSPLPEP